MTSQQVQSLMDAVECIANSVQRIAETQDAMFDYLVNPTRERKPEKAEEEKPKEEKPSKPTENLVAKTRSKQDVIKMCRALVKVFDSAEDPKARKKLLDVWSQFESQTAEGKGKCLADLSEADYGKAIEYIIHLIQTEIIELGKRLDDEASKAIRKKFGTKRLTEPTDKLAEIHAAIIEALPQPKKDEF
jgi:Asp-tRNA(Asn)/Glu-tRNA(Gln) amidotransferase A subunit family amidase